MSIRRICIDSRYRDYQQYSHAVFYYTLKRSVSCPPGARLYVDYVQIPNTVKTIQAGVNDKLFWMTRVGGGTPTFNYDIIPEGPYDGASLAAVVKQKLGDASTVSYDEANLALNVGSTLEFRFGLPSGKTADPTLKDQSCSAVIEQTLPYATYSIMDIRQHPPTA